MDPNEVIDFKGETFMEILLIDYRWVIVCFLLLPLSFLYNLWFYTRNKIIFHLNSAPRAHDDKVRKIQKQVQEWNKSDKSKKMCTARPGYQTMSFRKPLYKSTMHQVECNLIDILEVDREKRTVRVEPLATMDQVSETLAKLGWTIAIVPELDDLTVGGLVMGTGVESSSHIYGLFQHICLSYELVLADGSVVKCSKDENPDLFYAVPWSYGTLGFLTAVEIKILPATKYIRMEYEPVFGLENIAKRFNDVSHDANNHFVEGLQYSLDEAVIMTAVMVPDHEVDHRKINDVGKWYKPWFFKHVENILKTVPKGQTITEYLPLRDYYHRHSRALFWELQDIVPFGNHPIFRYLFGWLMPVKVSFLKLTQPETVKKLYEETQVIQDLLVPTSKMADCIREFNKLVNVYPLWLCPFRLWNNPGMVHPAAGFEVDMYVDIGVYGTVKLKRGQFHAERTTRQLEDIVVKSNGFQMLYADCFRTKDEFRQMFDHRLYDRMRRELKCEEAFPEVYDKINKKVRD
ncbi:delta(24)-sterol reductase-like [Sitodiplosis mosellana]|uniref:delta(24)-sterol reductase-like n=1 Tax=Sitodiplosis mosellana TaxID=263140 RepID=UPI0024450DC9|nr:delta(24)-sterol reductase-like [Sitodiplosis mosellana]